jgi:hypothetical protein
MDGLLKEINKVKQMLKHGPANTLLLQQPFAEGMYLFSMFMINYYSRIKKNLKLDYDSFIILQTVVSHSLYQLKKKKNGTNPKTYSELSSALDPESEEYTTPIEVVLNLKKDQNLKLTISSICLVLALPKETVRRKVNQLVTKKLLKVSNNEGINLGPMYKKIFQNFVPETVLETSKLIKRWEKTGVLKGLLNLKV